MAEALKYIIDEQGQKTSVLVPIEVWEEINANYRQLQHKLTVFSRLQQGLVEAAVAKEGGKPLQTLQDFLK